MSNKSGYRQTDGNGKLLLWYFRGREMWRKHKSGHSSDGFDDNTSFAYVREVKKNATIEE